MKLFNVLVTLAIVLTSLGIVSAQPVPVSITAYSVTGVQVSTSTDLGVTSYTAMVSINQNPKTTGFANGAFITINTTGACTYVVPGGVNGIIVTNGAATTILFDDGATCPVKSIVPTPEQSKTKNGRTNPFKR